MLIHLNRCSQMNGPAQTFKNAGQGSQINSSVQFHWKKVLTLKPSNPAGGNSPRCLKTFNMLEAASRASFVSAASLFSRTWNQKEKFQAKGWDTDERFGWNYKPHHKAPGNGCMVSPSWKWRRPFLKDPVFCDALQWNYILSQILCWHQISRKSWHPKKVGRPSQSLLVVPKKASCQSFWKHSNSSKIWSSVHVVFFFNYFTTKFFPPRKCHFGWRCWFFCWTVCSLPSSRQRNCRRTSFE